MALTTHERIDMRPTGFINGIRRHSRPKLQISGFIMATIIRNRQYVNIQGTVGLHVCKRGRLCM